MRRGLVLALLALTAAGCGHAKPAGPTVPNVRGENLPDAVVAVLRARLCPRLRPGKPEAWGSKTEPVVAQSPAPGAHVARWSTVIVTARLPQVPGAKGSTGMDIFTFGGANVKVPCAPISP